MAIGYDPFAFGDSAGTGGTDLSKAMTGLSESFNSVNALPLDNLLDRISDARPAHERVAFHGLDLYSLYSSIRAVLEYLEEVDPDLAIHARQRYECLAPFEE